MKIQNTLTKRRYNKMFKYLLSILLLSLLVIGCNQESNLVSPQDTVNNSQVVSEPNWITLPSSLSLKKDVSVSKWISGNDESLLEINTGYAGGPMGWISITANARFQRYSFWGTRYITMSINDQCGVADFSPSGSFYRPVIYNLTIQGIDVSKINPYTVSFVYMAEDGNYYKANYDKIYVDKQAGKLQVVNAELPHFSRYGFVN
jgi:hypothetical protein